MNKPLSKGIIKTIIALAGKETIINGLDQLNEYILDQKAAYVLNEGEREVISFQYERDGEIYNAFATLKDNGEFSRIESPAPIKDLLLKLLETL